MASGIFALLDDIALLMDDVATMGKIATKKTAAILGDDLAVNAEKASGFLSSRELPVLWEITKGSLLNKLMILPVAFLLSAYLPIAITIILLIGGLYLAYEGAEKIHAFFVPHKPKEKQKKAKKNMTKEEALKQEKTKIKSAIFTDFILSIEIVIIALSAVTQQTILVQILVVSIVSLLATVGVYGIVALLVRMDDFGYKLIDFNKQDKSLSDSLGHFLVQALPKVIKSLSVIGTIALVLVSGGIFVHNIHFIHDLFKAVPPILGELITGLIVGFITLGVVNVFKSLFSKKA